MVLMGTKQFGVYEPPYSFLSWVLCELFRCVGRLIFSNDLEDERASTIWQCFVYKSVLLLIMVNYFF